MHAGASGETGGSEAAGRVHYDRVTIGFHWLTALCVVVLFSTTLWWNYAPKGIRFRFELEDFHVSLGIVFAVLVIGRMAWRTIAGRRLPPAANGVQQVLAKLVHWLLYLLLGVQIVSGLTLRMLQGGELSFFGFFLLPALLERNREAAELVETLHNLAGWAIVIVAAGHALMALLHHHVWKDGVLTRMLPGAAQKRQRV